MPYTMQDYQREVAKRYLDQLTPEERLEGLAPDELLKGLSPDDRLKGLSPEEIRAYLEKLTQQKNA